MKDLDGYYAAAVMRLREVGAYGAARRWEWRDVDTLDRTAAARAVMAAIDAFEARRAAALDPVNADMWLAISRDQTARSMAALELCWVGEVAR